MVSPVAPVASAAIPYNKPGLMGRELEYVAEALAGHHISGDGPFSQRCHALLERELGVRRVLLTTSGTQALELAALLLDVQPGDEVIVPSFTFVSTANAFALRGARPVFADIRPDTLNLDETDVARRWSARTKVVVPVHYAGVGCEMEPLQQLAARRGGTLVEDAAHALFGKYRGRWLGTFGALAALSFHETKNFSCGEGGALLVNEERFVERAEIMREKGTDRARFFRGAVARYTWLDLGTSGLASDILAAVLYAQLEARERIQQARRGIWHRYAEQLQEWAAAQGVTLPVVPPHCEPPYHLFHLLMPDEAARDRLIAHLRRQGVLSIFHYVPLHVSPMGQRFGGRPGDCPVAEDVSRRIVRLPFYNTMTAAEQDRVIELVREAT